MPFAEQFTVVFSNAALHWVSDHLPVLQGIAHSLKPGGKALLQMGGQGNASEIAAACNRVMASSRWSRYFDGFSLPFGFHGPREYGEWLQAAGLTPVRVELFPRDMVHDGKEGLTGWLRTTHLLPYLERLPASEREAFIAETVEAYLGRHPIDEQGNARVKMVRLEVEALKP